MHAYISERIRDGRERESAIRIVLDDRLLTRNGLTVLLDLLHAERELIGLKRGCYLPFGNCDALRPAEGYFPTSGVGVREAQ